MSEKHVTRRQLFDEPFHCLTPRPPRYAGPCQDCGGGERGIHRVQLGEVDYELCSYCKRRIEDRDRGKVMVRV